jgi:hypothetical protein
MRATQQLQDRNKKMKLAPTITRNQVNGSWKVSDIVGGYLVTRVYMGYTKREALATFKREMREGNK